MRSHLVVFTLFVLLVCVWTYPLVLDLTATFPGTSADADVVTFIWNLWWMKYALVDLHTNPFVCDYVFAPHTVDLRLHTFAPLHGVVSIPVQALFGPIGAFNVLLLLTMALNGSMTYALAHRVWKERDVACLAAVLVAFNPAVTFFIVTGRPSFASVWILAVATILLERGGTKDFVALGVVSIAAVLTDFQIALFLALWLIAYSVAARKVTPKLLVSMAIAAVPMAFFLPALMDPRNPPPSLEDSLVYSLQIGSFADPPTLRFLLGWTLPVLTLLAVYVSRARPRVLPWLITGGVFIVLALGARLQPTDVPLPFALLRELPGLGQFRTPYRFTVPAALALALAGAGAAAHLRERWHRRLVAAAIVFALWDGFTAEPQNHPFEVQRYDREPIYERIAAEPEAFTVLQVPLGIRSGTDSFGAHETLQFYQMTHEKRGVNGMVARVPPEVFADYRASATFRFLAGESTEPPTESELREALRALDVDYVVVHKRWVSPETERAVTSLLGASTVADTRSVRAFRLR